MKRRKRRSITILITFSFFLNASLCYCAPSRFAGFHTLRPASTANSRDNLPKKMSVDSKDIEIRAARALSAISQNIVPVITQFNLQGERIVIDRAATRKLIDHIISLGVRSVLVMGATGEFKDLTNQQRLEAIRIFAEESKGRLTIFANATGDTDTETIENIIKIHTMPHINAVVIAPLCYLKDNKDIIPHISKIKEALSSRGIESQLPLVLYNNPGIHMVAASSIEPGVVKKLRSKIFAIKDSSGDLNLLKEYAKHTNTFQGDERSILDAFEKQAVGAVASMGNLLDLPQKLFQPGMTMAQLKRLQAEIKRLRDPLTANGKKIPAALKYYLSLLSISNGIVANPDKQLGEAEKEEIRRLKEELTAVKAADTKPAPGPTAEDASSKILKNIGAWQSAISKEIISRTIAIKKSVEKGSSFIGRTKVQVQPDTAKGDQAAAPKRSASDLLSEYLEIIEVMSENALTIDDDALLAKLIDGVQGIFTLLIDAPKGPEEEALCNNLASRYIELSRLIRIYRDISAVLRNSSYFTGDDFESNLVTLIEDRRLDLMERVQVSSGILFAANSFLGFVALSSPEAMAGVSIRQEIELKGYLPQIIRGALDGFILLKEDKLIALCHDLCFRFLYEESGQKQQILTDMLNILIEKKMLAFADSDEYLRSAVASRLFYISSKSADFEFLKESALILALIDYKKALEAVQKETAPYFTYHCFRALELMVKIRAYPPLIINKISEALNKKLDSSRWSKITNEKDLEAHIADPVQLTLREYLSMGVSEVLETNACLRVFEEYYTSEETDSLAYAKFQEALNRTNDIMNRTPRHLFLPRFAKPWASMDSPVPIPMGHDQTMSQPYLVQMMTAILNPQPDDKVMEIGTGSGYQAGILAQMTREVHTIEVHEDLAIRAKHTCANLGAKNIEFYVGDGSGGLPKEAEKKPFDIIIVTAGAPVVPDVLLGQLSEGGRLLIAVEDKERSRQHPTYDLALIIKHGITYKHIPIMKTWWVPLVGKYGYKDMDQGKEAYLGLPRKLQDTNESGLAQAQRCSPGALNEAAKAMASAA